MEKSETPVSPAPPVARNAGLVGVFHRFVNAKNAATAIEYALIGSGVSIVIVGACIAIGNALEVPFTTVANALN